MGGHDIGQVPSTSSGAWKRVVVGRLYPDSLFNDIVGEAFVIAGWVSLWVPIERLGFDGWLLEDNYRLYRRLAEMEVDIQPDA